MIIIWTLREQAIDVSVSVQFSHSVMSDSFWTHGLQHARPPCPSPTPKLYSNSCPLSRWCHPTISSCVLLPSIFPSIRVFSKESVLCIMCPKYWSFSFSISPSSDSSGPISFRMDWLDLPVLWFYVYMYENQMRDYRYTYDHHLIPLGPLGSLEMHPLGRPWWFSG